MVQLTKEHGHFFLMICDVFINLHHQLYHHEKEKTLM